MSIIRIFLFACLSVLCLLAQPISSFASDNVDTPKPYKATTVDECIDEKQCLKYVFLREVIGLDDSGDLIKARNFTVKKWSGPINFTVMGIGREYSDTANNLAKDLSRILHELEAFFGYKLKYTDDIEKVNSIIVYGSDLERKFSSKPAEYFRFLTPEIVSVIQESPFGYPKIIKIDEDGAYKEGAFLIDVETAQNQCLTSLVTRYLGINETPSPSFGIEGYDDCEISIIHKLLLTILMLKRITPGSELYEIENVFEEYYTKLMEMSSASNMQPSEFLNQMLRLR